MSATFEEFKELIEQTFNEYMEVKSIKKEIKDTEDRIAVLNGCIVRMSGTQTSYPIIVGNGLSRASITNLGTFPPFGYSRNYIYPMKYTVKKRFKPHKNYKRSMNNKVLYICVVESDGIVVTADDGYVWRGPGLWDLFKSDLGIENEFSSLEDFMVMTNPSVTKMIEAIGDLSEFGDYVPLAMRR